MISDLVKLNGHVYDCLGYNYRVCIGKNSYENIETHT